MTHVQVISHFDIWLSISLSKCLCLLSAGSHPKQGKKRPELLPPGRGVRHGVCTPSAFREHPPCLPDRELSCYPGSSWRTNQTGNTFISSYATQAFGGFMSLIVFYIFFLIISLLKGPFLVWEGAPGIRTSSRGHHRHVFLFRNYCIICKPKRDSNTETQAYVFKNMMKVSNIFCLFYILSEIQHDSCCTVPLGTAE